MKTVSTDLATHLGSDCTTLAVLWKAVRRDGTSFGFTTHDEDIVFNDGDGEVLYQASTGFTNDATETKSDMSVDNKEVTGLLDSDVITEQDIRAGLWKDAVIQIYIVNWADLTMGCIKIRRGRTGIIKTMNGMFSTEVRGLTQLLTTVLGQVYGPICRAELGSGLNDIDPGSHWLCNLDITAFRQTGTVDTSADAVTIAPESGLLMVGSATPLATAPSGWFNNGILMFTSGVLDGFWIELKTWDGTSLKTYLPMPAQPAHGDTFVIEPGCNHLITDCHTKFDNVVNFRGEFPPGNDLLMLYPDAK